MTTRSLFTTITPLPAGVSREAAVRMLHDHGEMIDLNPLVRSRQRIAAPAHTPADERACSWFAITDRAAWWPAAVAYTCAFHDLPLGLQTHCYAPLGVDIRGRWAVAGALPREPREPVELGLVGVPARGLYLREDVDLRCSWLVAPFVRKTLGKAHATLVRRLAAAAASSAPAALPAPAADKGDDGDDEDEAAAGAPPSARRRMSRHRRAQETMSPRRQ